MNQRCAVEPEVLGIGAIDAVGDAHGAEVTELTTGEQDRTVHVAIAVRRTIEGHRRIDRRLAAAAVWRAGEPGGITEPQQFPNQAQIDKSRANAAKAVVRDD